MLSYADGDEYYGAQAKHFLVRNPDNTIAYFRDFLGKEYDHDIPTTTSHLPEADSQPAASKPSIQRTAMPPPTPRMALEACPSP